MATLPIDDDHATAQEPNTPPAPRRTRSRATIAEVAAHAGVGLSTVSRVIRGAPGVSETTRKKVQDAVIAIGYSTDGVARSLRNNGRLDLIAMVVPDIGDPYFNEIYLHLQESILSRGECLLLGSHFEDLELQRDLLHLMTANRPASLVLIPAPGTTAEEIRAFQNQGIDVVILDRPVEGLAADTVLARNEEGAALLVDQFDFSGGERVAIVSLPIHIWTQERRLVATERALRERGIEPIVAIAEPARTSPSGAAFAPIFDRGIDTVFSMSVPPAMGVLRLAGERGVEAPRIGCFDRHPLFDLVHPSIVRVIQSPEQIAQRVIEHLERRRENSHAEIVTSVISFERDDA